MAVCQIERQRLLARISAAEEVLGTYRLLWKLYGELAEVAENPKPWLVARAFIADTVSPIVKKQLALYKESLENVTRAQEMGCMEVANGS